MIDRYADLRAALGDGWAQSIHPDTVRALLADYDRMRDALTAIEQWEVPLVESRGEAVSMSIAYGSNGVRDYFRGVARAAVEANSLSVDDLADIDDALANLIQDKRDYCPHEDGTAEQVARLESLRQRLTHGGNCAAVEAGRQRRMPSDEEIDKLSHGFALQYQDHVRGFARALIDRYSSGQPTVCQECGGDGAGGLHEDDCSQNSSGQPAASTGAPEHRKLREFYSVLTDDELIAAQQHHIEKLQTKLSAKQDLFPGRVREG